jgi:hypothetical protein
MNLPVAPQWQRSIIEAPGTCGGPAGYRQIVGRTQGGTGTEPRGGYSDTHAEPRGHRMNLTDSLCAHENPVVAYRARRLLAGESESSRALGKLRRAIGSSEMAKRLLLALNGERFNRFAGAASTCCAAHLETGCP